MARDPSQIRHTVTPPRPAPTTESLENTEKPCWSCSQKAPLADKGLADDVDAVIGVDTHTDSHSACVVDARGGQLASITVETTAQGYGRLLAFVADHAPGPRLVWAVEGTRSHGVGLTRFLRQAGHHVIEAGRPKRAQRRPGGKSDAHDALLAARDALTRTDHAVPRADGSREALRLLLLTRSTASGARTTALDSELADINRRRTEARATPRPQPLRLLERTTNSQLDNHRSVNYRVDLLRRATTPPSLAVPGPTRTPGPPAVPGPVPPA